MWDLIGSPAPELKAALESVSILWGIVPLPAVGGAAATAIPWGKVLGLLGTLGASWLGYRGAGKAGDRQAEALDKARESAERMALLQALLGNRGVERSLGAMISRAGTNYGTFKLPLLKRWGTGWPSQEQYEGSLRSGWSPMSDEDIRYLFEHGSLPRRLFSEKPFSGNGAPGSTWGGG